MSTAPPVTLGVWHIDATLAQMPPYREWLSDAESGRLQALRHEARRNQFLSAHWRARQLLAAHFGGRAEDWSLQRQPSGAPLAWREGRAGVWPLSLSHSGQAIACAVADFALGVDLEYAPRPRDFLSLAHNLYDRQTGFRWRHLDAPALRNAFMQRWTLDEAQAKARLQGLKWHALHEHVWEPAETLAQGWCWASGELWLAVAVPQPMSMPAFVVHGELLQGRPRGWRITTP